MSLQSRAALCLVQALLFLAGAASAAAPPRARERGPSVLRWPLEARTDLMSSFGEYRYDHLHAGIDISTGGVTGSPVLAAGPGTIVRLKVEWRGYGRALYIRHPDGRTTVYGHLDRFEDRVLGLERRVARRQAETKTRYPGDIYPDPPVTVSRGQVIGYSGESGVGLPHLHFEVRTAEDAPIDPFVSGLTPPPDRRPPVIESVIITAAEPKTFIDGSSRERTYRVLPRAAGAAVFEKPLRVTGPFLATVTAYDPVGGGRAGIHGVTIRIDGRVRYGLTFRTFRFSQYPLSGLIYDHRESRLGPSTYAYRLFRLPGNVLADGAPDAAASAAGGYPGAYDLSPGSHTMEVVVTDAAGNRTRVSACVQVARPVAPEVLESQAGGESSRGRILRFAVDALDAGGETGARSPRLPGCPEPGLVVEGDFWDGGARRFRPIDCSARSGTCSSRRPADDLRHASVRLRALRDGVPGPWVLSAGDGSSEPAASAKDLQLAAWPGFLDLLAPAEAPIVARLRLPGAGPATSVMALPYRDALTYGIGLSYVSLLDGSRPRGQGDDSMVTIPGIGYAAGVVGPGEPAHLEIAGISVDLPPGARFFPGALMLRTLRAPEESGLETEGEAVDLLPDGEALDEKGTLAFRLKEGVEGTAALGVYRWDRLRDSWSYEGGAADPGGRSVTLPFRRYGRFALLRDQSPPRITVVRPADGSRGVGPRARLEAAVVEKGMGLNFDGVAFVLDGAPVESEFDPDHGISRVFLLPPLKAGRHVLSVTATDRAGNSSPDTTSVFMVGKAAEEAR